MNFETVPIPERMKHLPLDRRGYPVPWMVYRDRDGRPHFQINDYHRRDRCLTHDLCAICGQKLFRGRWFVGGPWSALHELGCYIDPPTHAECCRYALQVCPYLAAPNYSKRVDVGTLPKDQLHPMMADDTVYPDRPEIFLAVMAIGQDTHGKDDPRQYVTPKRPYKAMEVWCEGKHLKGAEGTRILLEFLAKGQPDPAQAQEPRIFVVGA